jgi:molybdenum cofactor cytidylyltransferase
MKNIAVLILAAGSSSRMKRPKQLVKIGNKFLLEMVLSKGKSIDVKDVYCVLGANNTGIRNVVSFPNIHFLNHDNYDKGLSASIAFGVSKIALEDQSYDAILILLGDQPAIEKDYLNAMIALFSEDTTKVIASNYGNRLGVPAIFPKSYFSELQELSGDFGAKNLLNKNKEVVAFNKKTNFIDIDTAEDLRNFKNSILK